MYMLHIDGTLKQGKNNEFLDAWSKQILPLLKRQDGFVDEILLFEEGTRPGCVGLSFWNTQEQRERYYRQVFPQAKNFVQHLLDGEPSVRNFEVEASEIFKIAAPKAA
jgi:hypothetical protein